MLVGASCLEDGGKRYKIEKTVVHPDYGLDTHEANIALVKVKDEIEFNEHVQPISYSTEDFSDDLDVVVAAWNQLEVSNF